MMLLIKQEKWHLQRKQIENDQSRERRKEGMQNTIIPHKRKGVPKENNSCIVE